MYFSPRSIIRSLKKRNNPTSLDKKQFIEKLEECFDFEIPDDHQKVSLIKIDQQENMLEIYIKKPNVFTPLLIEKLSEEGFTITEHGFSYKISHHYKKNLTEIINIVNQKKEVIIAQFKKTRLAKKHKYELNCKKYRDQASECLVNSYKKLLNKQNLFKKYSTPLNDVMKQLALCYSFLLKNCPLSYNNQILYVTDNDAVYNSNDKSLRLNYMIKNRIYLGEKRGDFKKSRGKYYFEYTEESARNELAWVLAIFCVKYEIPFPKNIEFNEIRKKIDDPKSKLPQVR